MPALAVRRPVPRFHDLCRVLMEMDRQAKGIRKSESALHFR
jgi:hypothetical protein